MFVKHTFQLAWLATRNRSRLLSGWPVALALAAVHHPLAADAQVIVQPYITWMDQTRATIQWETAVASSSMVEFGLTGSYGQTASSAGLSTVHKVVVNNLTKDTPYYYRAASTAGGTTAYSSPYTFRTGVDRSTPFRFAFMADTRRDSGSPIPLHTQDVANAIYARNPNFTINAGDVTMGNDVLTIADTRQEYRTQLFGTSTQLMATKPYFIAIGDHERRGAGSDQVFSENFSGYESPYWQHTYYTYTYGNARFINLDTTITSDHAAGVEVPGIGVGSAQYNWLVSTLQNNTSDWTFVSYHYGTYQSADRFLARDLEMRATLGPVFDQYGVDMVLTGHAHAYERSVPIEHDVRNDATGTIYVTAGIGGASLSPEPPGSSLTAAKFSDWGYTMIDVNGGIVAFTAYDLSGNIKDQVSMTKGAVVSGTWNRDSAGDWNIASNWSGNAVPNSAGAVANFGSITTSSRTVYSDSARTVGVLRFSGAQKYVLAGSGSLSINVSSGAGSVEVSRGSHKINLPLFFASDSNISIASGATLTIADPATIQPGKTVTRACCEL